MRKQWKNVVGISGMLFFGLLTSCTDDTIQSDLSNLEDLSLKFAAEDAEINEVMDASSDIIEEVYVGIENPVTKSYVANRFMPSCATVTKKKMDGKRVVTVDFGEQCTLRNGNEVAGKIQFSYQINMDEASRMIRYEYQNFQFNGRQVNGGGTLLRERQNAQGNPQSTKTVDISVTWPDGMVVSRKGERIREMIEGQSTVAWGDNVFLITGNWNLTRKNGIEISVSIIEALRRKMSCKFVVSGVVELKRGERSSLLDYGNGECDDLASIRINGGEPKEFHLGK
ncbi:hypothetical protein MWU59_02960 [Flavobacteriaceae bacterium F08102]|nr:hypothetical protein [Flavobacteriaceae bacterium F08102]